jgi:hypothetical protein
MLNHVCLVVPERCSRMVSGQVNIRK